MTTDQIDYRLRQMESSIGGLGTKVEVLTAEVKTAHVTMSKTIQEHHEIINGVPGDDDRPGIRLNVDRLVRDDSRRTKHLWMLWGTLLSVIGTLTGAGILYLIGLKDG
jgi:hypothetical protein